jgi:hypothetical protein
MRGLNDYETWVQMPKSKTNIVKKTDSSWSVKIPKVKESKSQTSSIDKSVVLSSSINLLKKSYQIIKFQWKFLSLVFLTYTLLSVALVINISAFSSVRSLKGSYTHGLSTIGSNISASLSTLGSLSSTVSSSGSSSGGFIQFLLFILFSLIFIKGIREANKSRTLKFSEGIYSSIHPFLQFLLVILLLIAESIPILFAASIYQIIFSNGIATSVIEKLIWIIICGLILALGLYLMISTVFALFIVTLPNMRPWASMKSSWQLVKTRRLLIIRKIVTMLVLLFISFGLIALLLVLLVPIISAWLLLIIGLASMVIIYTYTYSLYKELI